MQYELFLNFFVTVDDFCFFFLKNYSDHKCIMAGQCTTVPLSSAKCELPDCDWDGRAERWVRGRCSYTLHFSLTPALTDSWTGMQESDPGAIVTINIGIMFLQTIDMSNVYISYVASCQHITHTDMLKLNIALYFDFQFSVVTTLWLRSGLSTKTTWLGLRSRIVSFPSSSWHESQLIYMQWINMTISYRHIKFYASMVCRNMQHTTSTFYSVDWAARGAKGQGPQSWTLWCYYFSSFLQTKNPESPSEYF